MPIDYRNMTDEFEKYEVDVAAFSHQHHVGVAFEMLSRYDYLTAAQKYSDIINTVATNAGASDKFNTTITLAFLSIISERMALAEFKDANEFMDKNPDLLTQNPLSSYYSKDRIASTFARKMFLLPDRYGADLNAEEKRA